MNTNLWNKGVLLYGDSLVYGKTSGRNERLDVKTRFSGVLQDLLGPDFEVIEEGLRGRTLKGENAFFKNRDGFAQFPAIIGSHLPVEWVVIILGTNDCNAGADKSPEEIAESLRLYPPIIHEWCEFLKVSQPKLMIIAPPNINPAFYDDGSAKIFGMSAQEKAKALPGLYGRIAEELEAEFLSLAEVCQPANGDGIHLDASGNRAVAEAIAEKINQ
jgi:lysophospholipase L1-like esterase